MLPTLASAMLALEQETTAMLAIVEDWPEARLARQPAQGQWSALEVLDHLERTERAIAIVMHQGLLRPHHIGVRDRLGTAMVHWVFRSKRRVSVPAKAALVLPDARTTRDAVDRRWAESRASLATLLASVRDDQLAGGVFRHPVAGWMSVPEVLRFFTVHLLHHGFQLERIRELTERG